MLAKLKSAGAVVGGFGVLLGLLLVPLLLLRGAASVGAWAYPFLTRLTAVITVMGLPLLLLLALVPRTRGIAGNGFRFVSYAYGICLWVWCLLYTLQVWGWLPVIIGLLMMGIGIMPIGLLAALLHGEWSIAGQMILLFVLTFGCRFGGGVLMAHAEERAARRPGAAI